MPSQKGDWWRPDLDETRRTNDLTARVERLERALLDKPVGTPVYWRGSVTDLVTDLKPLLSNYQRRRLYGELMDAFEVPTPDPDADRPCGCERQVELEARVKELFSALQDGRLLVEKLTHRIVQTRVFTPALRDEAEAWQKRTLKL